MKNRSSLHRAALATCAAILCTSIPSSAAAAEFLLGEHEALSGGLAKGGKSFHEGIVIAVKEFNKRQKAHTAKLVTIDDQSDPAKAVAAADELLSKGVIAFVGGYGSNIVGPASETVMRAGGVYITAGGTSPGLTERGYSRYFAYINSKGYAAPWLTLLPTEGVKKVSVIALKKEASQAVAHDLRDGLAKQGIAVTVHDFDDGVQDFKPILNVVRLRDRPDAVLVAAYEKENLGVMRAAQVLRPDVKIFGGTIAWAWDHMVETQGPLMNHTIGGGLLPYPRSFDTEEGRRFQESYEETFGGRPDYMSLWNYELATLMLEAMQKAHAAGKLDGETIATLLRNDGKPRKVMSGTVTFDAKGYNQTFAYRLVQYVPGGLQIVWPAEAAKSKPILPARSW